jgi:hypothetical protein
MPALPLLFLRLRRFLDHFFFSSFSSFGALRYLSLNHFHLASCPSCICGRVPKLDFFQKSK